MNRLNITIPTFLLLLGTTAPIRGQGSTAQDPEAFVPSLASREAVQLFEPTDAEAETNVGSTPAAFLPLPGYGGWVGVAKWVSLAAATGLGALGFVLHADASDTFDELTRRCNSNPDTCRARNPDGSYADPALEALFQDAVDRDNQARVSLIAGEISFGLSVLLFIVDFQKDPGPNNVPYDPDEDAAKLRLDLQPDELLLRYYIN